MTTALTDQYILELQIFRNRADAPAEYPFTIPAVRSLKRLKLHPKVTFFVGDNGTGKSTIIEAIAVAAELNPEGGSRNFNFATRESHSTLHKVSRLVRGHKRPKDSYFFRNESLYNVATEVDRLHDINPTPKFIELYGGRSLHEQSHGQATASLFFKRFWGEGLYLLDEPEAALSPERQLAFLSHMHDLVHSGSQFIIATHSPIIIAYPEAWIYDFSKGKIERVAYRDTEHYAIYKKFINDPESMLATLLDSDTKKAR